MEHLRHFAKFEASNTRNPYEIRAAGEGWFLYCDVLDYQRRHQLITTTRYAHRERELVYWDPRLGISRTRNVSSWWPAWDDFAFVDQQLKASYVNGKWTEHSLRGAFLKPYIIGMTEAMVKAEFTFTPAVAGWDFADNGDGTFVEMIQGQGIDTTTAVTYADMVETKVDWAPTGDLCPNIFFAFGFRRQALDLDTLELLDTLSGTADLAPEIALGTTCYFGGSARSATEETGHYEGGFAWRLFIPLNGRPVLQRSIYSSDTDANGTWVPCQWSAGELSEFNYYDMAVSGKTYYIGVLGNCICVSEDRFEDNFAVFEVIDRAQPIIPSGHVRLHNWPGQCAFWMAPLGFVQDESTPRSYLESAAIAVGNYRGDLIGDGRWYIIGYSPKGLYDPAALEWTAEVPEWWPDDGEWWDGGFFKTWDPPLWPPFGPPGEWPALPPPGWPQGTDWPPTQDPPAPVNPTITKMSGGGVSLYYWPYDAPETGNPEWLKWRVYAEPAMWTPGGTAMPTFTTPFIESVTIWQAAEYQSPANTQSYVTPAAVKSVSIAEPELGNDTSINADLTIDNVASNYGNTSPSAVLREGSLCRITVGTEFTDGSSESVVYNDLILTGISADPQFAQIRFADPLGMAALDVWDAGELNFQLWNPASAIACVLGLRGIPTSLMDLEDLGMVLVGDWKFETGTGIGEIVSRIAQYAGNSAVWWDPVARQVKSGCPYCRTKRTSSDYTTHQDNAWNSTGCVAADIARAGNAEGSDWTLVYDVAQGGTLSLVFAESFSAQGSRLTGNYVNRVTAQGTAFDGQPLRLLVQDNKAFGTDGSFDTTRYVGWRKPTVVDVDGEATWASLKQAVLDNKLAYSERGIEVPGVTLPLNIGVRVGHVMTVVGGYHAIANGKKFRIRSVQHDPGSGRTTVGLRQMMGASG